MRINLAAVAHHSILADAGKRSDIAVLPYLGRRSDGCQRTDACLLRLHRFIELKQLRYGLVCVLHADERSLHGAFEHHILIYQYDT